MVFRFDPDPLIHSAAVLPFKALPTNSETQGYGPDPISVDYLQSVQDFNGPILASVFLVVLKTDGSISGLTGTVQGASSPMICCSSLCAVCETAHPRSLFVCTTLWLAQAV